MPTYTYTQASASSFTSFDTTTSKFSINTSASANIGLNTVTVTISMTQPTTTLTKTFSFDINVFDTCLSTVLSFSPAVSNMVAYVNQGAVTQTVTTIDTAGQTYSNSLICGARIFTISPATLPYLSLSSGVLTLQSTDPA